VYADSTKSGAAGLRPTSEVELTFFFHCSKPIFNIIKLYFIYIFVCINRPLNIKFFRESFLFKLLAFQGLRSFDFIGCSLQSRQILFRSFLQI